MMVALTMAGLGGRVPDGMKTKLEHIISSGVTLPNLVHYLRYVLNLHKQGRVIIDGLDFWTPGVPETTRPRSTISIATSTTPCAAATAARTSTRC